MVLFGIFGMRGGTKKVNWWLGYRTSMASKNQETWVFVHKHWGRLSLIIALVLIALSTTIVILEYADVFALSLSIIIPILIGVQLLSILLTIILTEKALKQKFDKNGNIKN
ncbi:MAG: SdpI family protein [Defluviitaleaceae bacterium]|nr:SdpI family protein [Defluviitaleaceae bacterium]